MTNTEFEKVYYPKYESVIKAIARKIAHRNDALMDDLIAEGMIALWKLEPSKAKDNPDAYIRQAIKFRMIDWMRREKPAMYDSLTRLLENGDQLVQDPDTNEVCLIRVLEPNHRVARELDEVEQNVSRAEKARDRQAEVQEED